MALGEDNAIGPPGGDRVPSKNLIRFDDVEIDRTAFDWEAWARSDPALAQELAAYRTVASPDRHAILQRRD